MEQVSTGCSDSYLTAGVTTSCPGPPVAVASPQLCVELRWPLLGLFHGIHCPVCNLTGAPVRAGRFFTLIGPTRGSSALLLFDSVVIAVFSAFQESPERSPRSDPMKLFYIFIFIAFFLSPAMPGKASG